jgi:hypothetical protein
LSGGGWVDCEGVLGPGGEDTLEYWCCCLTPWGAIFDLEAANDGLATLLGDWEKDNRVTVEEVADGASVEKRASSYSTASSAGTRIIEGYSLNKLYWYTVWDTVCGR